MIASVEATTLQIVLRGEVSLFTTRIEAGLWCERLKTFFRAGGDWLLTPHQDSADTGVVDCSLGVGVSTHDFELMELQGASSLECFSSVSPPAGRRSTKVPREESLQPLEHLLVLR